MTLGQATGGRPRAVAARPGTAPRPTAPRLGLGLGLGARQRGAFQQAAQGGNAQQFLAARPWLQQRVNQLNPNSVQAGRLQNFMATGQNQRPPRFPQPPTGGYAPPPGAQGLQPTQFNPSMGMIGGNMNGQVGTQPPPSSQYPIGSGAMGPSFGSGGPYGGTAYGGDGGYGGGYGGGNPYGVNSGMQSVVASRMGGALGSFNQPTPGYHQEGDFMMPNQLTGGGQMTTGDAARQARLSQQGGGGFGGYGGGLVQGGVYNRPGQANPYQFGGGGGGGGWGGGFQPMQSQPMQTMPQARRPQTPAGPSANYGATQMQM